MAIMHNTAPIIKIVVPCFNEEVRISQLIVSLHELAQLAQNNNFSISVMLVNNGCTDATFTTAKRDIERHLICCTFEILNVPVNRGYGFGVKSALQKEYLTTICLIPADGKYNVEDIFKVIKSYQDIQDTSVLVKGLRIQRNDPKSIQILSFFYSFFVRRLLGTLAVDINGLPKLFLNHLQPTEIEILSDNACFDASFLSMWAKKGLRLQEIPVSFTQNLDSTASWSGKRFLVSMRMFREMLQTRKRMSKYL
jgi:hypothetical protein